MNLSAPTGTSPQTKRSRRILFPQEHGAYGQFLFPLLTALLLGARLPGAGLALAFSLAFLLHEPVLVLMGHRGPRARDQFEKLARRQCLLLGGATILILAVLAPQLNVAARWSILLPAAAAASISVFIFLGKERTSAGELTAAAGLSACCVPVAVANGSGLAAAVICWTIWAAVLMSATLAVRGIIARAKYGEARLARRAVLLGAAGTACAAVLLHLLALPFLLLWAAAPAVLLPLILHLLQPSPRYLRTIGWSAMSVDFAIAGLLIAALR